jgi:hypothetical protein
MDGQNALFDRRVGPHSRQELVLRDEMPCVPEQQDQHVVGFRRETNDLRTMCEPSLCGFQRELAKMKDVPAAHGDFGES